MRKFKKYFQNLTILEKIILVQVVIDIAVSGVNLTCNQSIKIKEVYNMDKIKKIFKDPNLSLKITIVQVIVDIIAVVLMVISLIK